MSRFWSPIVHTLSPYVPGEQPRIANLVKLNTNENPYGPSTKVLTAMQAELADTLRLYPDPTSEKLRQAIARQAGVSAEQVFVGNGSDEVLAFAFMALLKQAKPILFPDITYSFYPVYCSLFEIEYRTVPLDAAFQIQTTDYLQPNGGIVFPNPNAPTGCGISLAAVETILLCNPEAVVVVDEAYVDFGAESATSLVSRYPNLLVVQTLSKSRSLAGLRIGFAIGDTALIQGLVRIKDSFNSYPLDRLAIAGATAAMEDRDHFDATCRAIINSRDQLSAELAALGFEVLPSQANFLFARHPRHEGAELASALRRKNILVRHFRLPRIEQFLRITVGTPDQCKMLVTALAEILG